MPIELPFSQKLSKKEATLVITPVGEEKLNKLEGGGLLFTALYQLKESSPMTIAEMKQKLHLDSHEKAVTLANQMIENRWASKA